MALALAPRIRVNAIGPGPVLPSTHQTAGQFRRQWSKLPLGRQTKPEEIAEVFLQTAFYCGNPAGVEALIILVDAVDALRDLGSLPNEPVVPEGWTPQT